MPTGECLLVWKIALSLYPCLSPTPGSPCVPAPQPSLTWIPPPPPNLFSYSLWMLLPSSTPRNINLTVSSSVPGYSN